MQGTNRRKLGGGGAKRKGDNESLERERRKACSGLKGSERKCWRAERGEGEACFSLC